MPTNLSRLKVSLTKHGAHKIAQLLTLVTPDQILTSVWGKFPGINIDGAQVRSILSVNDEDAPPQLWWDAKQCGDTTIRATTLLAIIFSHHRLIEVLGDSSQDYAAGTVLRSAIKDTKEFTNLKDDIRSLRFSTSDEVNEVRYNFQELFSNPNIPRIAAQLFELKLVKAGWDRRTTLLDECIAQKFHRALSLSENQFREWLSFGFRPDEYEITEDELRRTVADDNVYATFEFKSGHRPRKASANRNVPRMADKSVELAHNQLQSKLYKHLCERFGADNVGTEKNRIDIVVRDGAALTFFEIKVGMEIRSCIREALSQLLEYAYWPDGDRATRLIIVTPCAPTNAAKKYMRTLRERFNIPIYYQQTDTTTGELSELI